MANGGFFEGLRSDYLAIIEKQDLKYTHHIRKISDWVFYPYFCLLTSEYLPNHQAKIIDWGGMYGQVTAILMRMGYQDVSNYLLHRTPSYELFQEQFTLPTIYGEAPNRLSIKDATVDGFISAGVLEHVCDDGMGDEDQILEEIHRVLKPGGYFFIWNLPAKLGSSELMAAIVGKWRHERRFWLKEIISLLTKHRFVIEFTDKHKFLPGSLSNRLAQKIDIISLTKWDHHLSHLFPFNIFARDYLIVAKRVYG